MADSRGARGSWATAWTFWALLLGYSLSLWIFSFGPGRHLELVDIHLSSWTSIWALGKKFSLVDTTRALMQQFELRDKYLSSWETAWAQGHLPELFNKSLSSWKMEIHMNILGKTLSFWTSNWALGPELEHLVTQSWTTTWAPGHKPDHSRNSMSSWETAWAVRGLSQLPFVKN